MYADVLLCDSSGCLAMFHSDDVSGRIDLASAACGYGWDCPTNGSAQCPACRSGRGPVVQRGECPACMGASVVLKDGEHCHFCGHLVPADIDGMAFEYPEP